MGVREEGEPGQGCATCITLGARSSQQSGTKKASSAKLICKNRGKNVLGHNSGVAQLHVCLHYLGNHSTKTLHPLYMYILVKVPCECITGNIARGRGREPIKHEAQPSALFARDHAPSAIFSVMHERERYFNWFIVAEFLASAAINDSKWALRSKLPITMLGRSRGKTGEPL